MIRKLLLPMLLASYCMGAPKIETDRAQLRKIGTVTEVNAEITQLSDQKEQIVSRIAGEILGYHVKTGDKVNKGTPLVTIRSMALSRLSAEYLGLAAQEHAAASKYRTAKALYAKGLGSKNALNTQRAALEAIRGKRAAIAAQLRLLDIDPKRLRQSIDRFTLKAHSAGRVGRIYRPLHAGIKAQEKLMDIVKGQGYYAVAYMRPVDALKVDGTTHAQLRFAGRFIDASFVQRYADIDKETQRAKVLFALQGDTGMLLRGMFLPMRIQLPPYHETVVIKRSALTLFNSEWTVFLPKGDTDRHDEHRKSHEHKEDQQHKEESEDDEDEHVHGNKEHEEHEAHHHHEHHESIPYEIRIVKPIAFIGDLVAIEGLEANETYISKGVYYLKSRLLKASLGEHGH